MGATAIAAGADAVKEVMRPNTEQAATNGASLIVQAAIEQIPSSKGLIWEKLRTHPSPCTFKNGLTRVLPVSLL